MKIEFAVRLRRPSGFTLEAEFAGESDALGLVGPSGCGKSTLLDALAGIEPGARVVVDGADLSRRPLHERAVGTVAQDPLLFPHLSVRENLLYSPRASGDPAPVARELGIEHLLDRMPRHLSGGERRRAALARAILSRPRLLLLDEPFAGLDETRRRDAMSLLDRARRRAGIPMILVSHRPEEVVGLAERAIRLEGGRIAAAGPSAALLRAGETLVDNYFTGTVTGPHRVTAGGVELQAMIPEGASGEIRLACYAQDILLAGDLPAGLSARNAFRTRAIAVTEARDVVLAELESPRLRAILTPEAARALELAPGRKIVAVIKATSIACLGAA